MSNDDISTPDGLWRQIKREAGHNASIEPVLASFYRESLLRHDSLAQALSHTLSLKLASASLKAGEIAPVIVAALRSDENLLDAVCADVRAHVDRDPACDEYLMPLLYFKGFHAMQTHRTSHWLWRQGRRDLALFLQNRATMVFDVDIHPAAEIGRGVMIDHATGVVIGETAVIGNNVSMLHGVTLGGCGCSAGDRHPKVADGVLISASAKLLGNIRIGEGAKIAAGSLVLDDVAPHTTVAGVPARVVGRPRADQPALDMGQELS